MQEREKRTVLQRSDALESHAKVVRVQESRGVVKEFYILSAPDTRVRLSLQAKRRSGLTRIVTMDMVVAATETRRVLFSFSIANKVEISHARPSSQRE